MTIFGTASGGVFSCPHCRARYAVTHVHLLAPKKGQSKCIVCDRTMSVWETAEQPSYTLIERPKAP